MVGNWNDNKIKEVLAARAKDRITLQMNDPGAVIYDKNCRRAP